MNIFKFSIGILILSITAEADLWQTSFHESGVARSPGWAKNAAVNQAALKTEYFLKLCADYKGTPAHSIFEESCQPVGAEDFRCFAKALVTCDLGKVEYAPNNNC